MLILDCYKQNCPEMLPYLIILKNAFKNDNSTPGAQVSHEW